MIDLKLTMDTKGLDKFALLTEKNIRFAAGRALAATVVATKKALEVDLKKTSGGPIEGGATRWTVGGTYVRRPSPTNLNAEVGLQSDKPRAAGRYISVLTRGGRPRTKGVDLFTAALAGDSKLTMVPTSGQRLDSKGNVSKSTLNKALTGWASMRKSRVLVNRANRFFIIPIKGAPGRMGIFERNGRRGKGEYGSFQGTTMRFTLEPNPKPRSSTYDLKGDLMRSTQRYWPGEIRQNLMAELARAGFR